MSSNSISKPKTFFSLFLPTIFSYYFWVDTIQITIHYIHLCRNQKFGWPQCFEFYQRILDSKKLKSTKNVRKSANCTKVKIIPNVMFLVIFKHCDVGDSFKAGFITVEVTKKTNFSMPSNLYWNSTCNYLKHLLNLLFQNGKVCHFIHQQQRKRFF